jgi:hypothetical protein
MKVLGVLLLVPLVVLYMLLVQSLAFLHAASTTVGNAAVFQTEFDRNVSLKDLEGLADELVASQGGGDSTGLEIDSVWLSRILRKIVLGTQTYFIGASDQLPTLDVSPLLTSLEDTVIAGILENNDDISDAELAKFTYALKKLPGGGLEEGAPSEAALTFAKSESAISSLGLSNTALIAIVQELLAPRDSATMESATVRVVRIAIQDKLNLEQAEAGLSLDKFVTSLFGTEDNIVQVGRNRGLDIANAVVPAAGLLLVLLIALIVLFSFSVRSTPLWLGIPLFLAGFGIFLTSAVSTLYRAAIPDWLGSLGQGGTGGMEPAFLLDFVLALFDRLTRRLMLDGLLLLVPGILLIVLAIVLGSAQCRQRRETARNDRKDRYWQLLLLRVPLVLLVGYLVYLNVVTCAVQVGQDVAAIREAVSEPKGNNILDVMDNTLGTSFKQFMS